MLSKIIIDYKNFDIKIPVLLILIFPIFLLSGSAFINLSIIIIDLIFIYHLYKNKNLDFIKGNKIYLLFFLWFYLLLNSLISSHLLLSFEKALGFLRFIIFSYAINYYLNFNNKKYLNPILIAWSAIFFIVCFDILYEYFIGKNILGHESNYAGRISSFLGEELKIGHFFLGFAFIVTFYLHQFKIKNFAFIFLIFFLIISLIIGERSNFVKFFIITILFFLFFEIKFLNLKKKILLLFISICILVSSFTLANKQIHNRYVGQFISPILKYGYINYLKNTQHGAHRNAAKLIFKDNIFFGSGLKTFRYESGKNKYENNSYKKTSIRASTHPHQIHWEILSELGIIGYFIFFGTFIYFLYKAIKSYYKSKNKNDELLILVSSFFVLVNLLPILPSGSFFTTYGASIFWINFSFLITPNKN